MKKTIISLTLLALMPCVAMAQDDKDTYNESVIVVGSFNPVLEECEKVYVAPTITDTATALQHKFTYNIAPKRLASLYNPTRIKAARIIGEPITRLYNSYLRIGMGNYGSPLADFYYNSTRNQKLSYGARLSHLSSWGSVGQKVDSLSLFSPNVYGKNHYAQTDMAVFGKYIVKEKLQISTDLSYNHDYGLYYGFSDSVLHLNDSVLGFAHSNTVNYRDSLQTSTYSAIYHYFNWNVGVKNLQTDVNKLGYETMLNLANLWGTYGQREFNMNLHGNVHYGFSLADKYKGIAFLRLGWERYGNTLHSDSLYRLPLGYRYNGTPATVLDTTEGSNIVTVNPYVEFLLRSFKIHAGATMAWNNYDHPDTVAFLLFPDISISKSFMKESLNISVGAEGGLHANSLNSMRLVNPYLAPSYGFDLLPTLATKEYELYARMRFNFSKKLQMKLHAEHSILRNDLSFELSDEFVLGNVYMPKYENLTRTALGGEFSFVNDEMMLFAIGGNYYLNTATDTLPTPLLYRPDFDAHATLQLNYKDKFLVRVQGVVLGKMNGAYEADAANAGMYVVTDTLPLRYGVSCEIEYRHTKALSVFLRGDNLAFQRYYLWSHYPSQRGLFIGGLTYTIPTKRR